MSKFDLIRDGQKEEEPLPDITFKFPNGACPRCHTVTGQLRVGRATILYCLSHKLFWSTGFLSRVTPTDQELSEQREQWTALGLDDFSETHPWLLGMRDDRDTDSGEPG